MEDAVRIFRLVATEFDVLNDETVEAWLNLTAVYYTHLDVYKRQVAEQVLYHVSVDGIIHLSLIHISTSLKILTASSMTYFSFAAVRLLTSDRFPCPMKNFTISLSS